MASRTNPARPTLPHSGEPQAELPALSIPFSASNLDPEGDMIKSKQTPKDSEERFDMTLFKLKEINSAVPGHSDYREVKLANFLSGPSKVEQAVTASETSTLPSYDKGMTLSPQSFLASFDGHFLFVASIIRHRVWQSRWKWEIIQWHRTPISS
jgi:hypothetical protein